MKSLLRKLNVRWKKSTEEESPSTDVTRKRIEYFMLQPKAKATMYLQTGEVVALKHDGESIRAMLHEVDRNQYRDSSYLWSMDDGNVIIVFLVPGEDWGVL